MRQQAVQITQPSLTCIDDSNNNNLVNISNETVNNNNNSDGSNDKLIKMLNYVNMSDSSTTTTFTPVLSSMSTSSTSSSISSASSVSPNLSLSNSITDKSFNTSNELVDCGVGVGRGLVTAHGNDSHLLLNGSSNGGLCVPIFKYASENYVITRL